MTASANFGISSTLMEVFGVARGAGAQIFNLIDNVPTINPLLNRGVTPTSIDGNIELRDVQFHYPSRPDVPVSTDYQSSLCLIPMLCKLKYDEDCNVIRNYINLNFDRFNHGWKSVCRLMKALAVMNSMLLRRSGGRPPKIGMDGRNWGRPLPSK